MTRWLIAGIMSVGAVLARPDGAVAQVIDDNPPSTRVYPRAIAERRLGQEAPPEVSPEEEAKRPVPKIVGGQPAERGQFPWQVALVSSLASKDDPFPGFFCGASLIGWRWVLTAAHCIYDADSSGQLAPIKAETVHVYLGSHDFTDGQRLEVKRIIPHAAYDTFSQDNDIALLELASEPANRAGLALIALIRGGDDSPVQPTKFATVAGWGSTEAGMVSQKLRKSVQVLQFIEDITFHDSKACNAEHLKSKRAWTRNRLLQKGLAQGQVNSLLAQWYPPDAALVTANMVCAGTNNGTKDACFGDSGGPLFVQRGNQRVQVGIVSWGPPEGCGLTALFGVFTRLSRYEGWISDNMR